MPYYEKGMADICVLDVDQQCVDPRIGKGQLYRALNEEIQDIPKIVINHGTPCWPERWEGGGEKRWNYPIGYDDSVLKNNLEHQRKFLVEGGKIIIGGEFTVVEGMEKLIGKNKMVVNSFKSREQWGWGKVIWHGLDPDEWWDLPKEPRSASMISTGGLDYYYGRDFLNSTISRLREDYGLKHVWISHPAIWQIFDSKIFSKQGGWDAYRDFLGRTMVFFNSTRESCMPRARTEAMLSGCCILTTGNQDEDRFINMDTRPLWADSEGVKDFISKVDELIFTEGINGLLVPENSQAVSTLINHLIYDIPETTLKIGKCGKETAKIIFNKSKFDQNWTKLLTETITRWKEKNAKKTVS